MSMLEIAAMQALGILELGFWVGDDHPEVEARKLLAKEQLQPLKEHYGVQAGFTRSTTIPTN